MRTTRKDTAASVYGQGSAQKGSKLTKSVLGQRTPSKTHIQRKKSIARVVSKEQLETDFTQQSMLNITADEDQKVSYKEIHDYQDVDLSLASGKLKSDKGILIHSLCDLFNKIGDIEKDGQRILMRVSYFEIYND